MRGRKIDVLGRTACIFSGADRTAKAKYFGTFLREVFLMDPYLGNFEEASSGRRLICDSRLLNFRILKVIYLSHPRILRRHRHTGISRRQERGENQNPQHLLSLPVLPWASSPPPPPDLTLHHDAKKVNSLPIYLLCGRRRSSLGRVGAEQKPRLKNGEISSSLQTFFVPSPPPSPGYFMTRAHPPSLLVQKRYKVCCA